MEPDYNLIGTGIDLLKVDPISQKRLLAFVNFWLLETVQFMNNCASQFESKFLEVDNRLRRLEASMALLEAKLSSIPGLDGDQVTSRLASTQVKEKVESHPVKADVSDAVSTAGTQAVEPAPSSDAKGDQSVAMEQRQEDLTKDPRYAKYFKMLQLGVPEDAVKQKMELEGMDPSILQKASNRSSSNHQPAAVKPRKEQSKAGGASSDSFSDSDESSFSD